MKNNTLEHYAGILSSISATEVSEMIGKLKASDGDPGLTQTLKSYRQSWLSDRLPEHDFMHLSKALLESREYRVSGSALETTARFLISHQAVAA